MTNYSLRHLSDDSLTVGLNTSATDDRLANATLLAHIAEFDRRDLCLPAGYPSMFRYCVGHLRMSEDIAYKRVRVARVARCLPGVFDAIASGRLNLSGVALLARHLTRANGRELLKAAVSRSRAEIQELLARCFPESASSASDAHASPGAEAASPAAPPGELLSDAQDENGQEPQQFAQAPGPVENAGVFGAPARNSLPELHVRITPIAPGRYELVAVIDQAAHDRLLASKELLGHAVPSGALVEVLQRAIALQHEHLRKRRCGATDPVRTSDSACGAAPCSCPNGSAARPAANSRRVPRAVQRAVWARDGERCAFISADGHRCEERGKLELDHMVPIASGGASTVDNLRLLCRAHNRHAAERAFGKEHVKARREEAQRHRAAERYHKQAERERIEKRKAEIERQREELGVAFQGLGWHGAKLERALGCCATRPEASPEDRIRYALSFMAPNARKEPASAA